MIPAFSGHPKGTLSLCPVSLTSKELHAAVRYISHLRNSATIGRPTAQRVGDFIGNCEPANHRREPVYRNITVRQALNLMALRSLEIARDANAGRPPGTARPLPKPISWKFRFRRDPVADTGLGGVPLFQTF